MAKYSKFNIVYLMQKWMDSVAGQTFMNYAYSWGAAVVILGTLFKLTHLPGANLMLFIGMGTEVFVFFISAFDRPFDKTQDGVELATDSQLAAEREAMEKANAGTSVVGTSVVGVSGVQSGTVSGVQGGASGVQGGGTIIIGGGSSIDANAASANGNIAPSAENTGVAAMNDADSQNIIGAAVQNGGAFIHQVGAPAPAVSLETAEAMEEATTTYVDRLNELNEMLLKVGALTERLSTDSQEMENLNRTLTGISRVYEMQLKSASQQITTQDEINEQTRRMATQIQELNAIYTRMIEAMTVNMAASSAVK